MPTDEATTMAENEVTSLNHNHPLYVQASDAPGVILVPINLTGPENYSLWIRSMKLAFRGKGNLNLLMDRVGRQLSNEQWRNNGKNGTDSVTSYYSKLKDLWAELDVMIPSPGCNCENSTAYVGHIRSQSLLKFLMGFNESFSSIRSNILAGKPTVTVNEAYAVATQEESQRALGVSERTRDHLTLLAGKAQTYNPRPKKFVPSGTICDHCGFKGHYKGDCYKLVGYPPGFQSKRKGIDGYKNDYKAAEGFRPDFKLNAHFTRNFHDFNDKEKQVEGHMTPPQYQDLVDRMDRAGTSYCVANMSVLKDLIALIKNQFGLCVKTLRSDNGTEFFNFSVNDLLASQSIIHQSSWAYSPQQNGKVERTAVYLINKLPTEVLGGRSPYEMLLKKISRLDHLRVFGCLCYAAQLPKGDKFAPRARKAIFLDYSETKKGYRLFDLIDKVFFVYRDVTFRESTFLYQTEFVSTDLDIFELQNLDYFSPHLIIFSGPPTDCNIALILGLIVETTPNNPTAELPPLPFPEEPFQIIDQFQSRASRNIKPPGWLGDYVTSSKDKPSSASCSYPISDSLQYSHFSTPYQIYLCSFSPQVEPKSFKETSQDAKWIAAMTDEL
ncbi:uncharacterized protein [Solanum lycopersicum]|uniref:uncharacterized protein n=1 Tax=Solanum lycopersicum TaxID=4081 RepID=UPI003747DE85